MRRVNEKAYTPVLVAIGPIHYNNKDLLPMEPDKLRCLRSFLDDSRVNADLNYYLELIKNKETQIRESYEETFPLPSEEFVRMVLIDSAFIIQLVRDKIPFVNPLFIDVLIQDLKLAENQLPFFILKELYRVAFNNTTKSCFTNIVCKRLNVITSRVKVDVDLEAVCLHLTDLLRSHHLPTRKPTFKCNQDEGSILCRTATSLYEAGVKFQPEIDSSSSSLLDISFDHEKGILTIPTLAVGDETESLLRNLIAFEQCDYYGRGEPTYLADYHFFLDKIINTMEDVKLLVKKKVIENLLGNEKEMSKLIKSLGIQVFSDGERYFYQRISKQLNDHCNKKWNRNMVTLKHVYFRHPWAVISLIAATILLFLTAVQVITGILAVPGVLK